MKPHSEFIESIRKAQTSVNTLQRQLAIILNTAEMIESVAMDTPMPAVDTQSEDLIAAFNDRAAQLLYRG